MKSRVINIWNFKDWQLNLKNLINGCNIIYRILSRTLTITINVDNS